MLNYPRLEKIENWRQSTNETRHGIGYKRPETQENPEEMLDYGYEKNISALERHRNIIKMKFKEYEAMSAKEYAQEVANHLPKRKRIKNNSKRINNKNRNKKFGKFYIIEELFKK